MSSRRIVVIMAGGAGERFWPVSRKTYPKQLLPLTGGDSMLKISIDRVANQIGLENIYILTAENLVSIIRELLPELPPENIVGEPVSRNTAPCLGLALAQTGYKEEDNVVMGVLTADHHIQNLDRFDSDLDTAFKEAEKGENLVTFGIPPSHPDTGFGYLEVEDKLYEEDQSEVYRIKRFCEKPDLETAKQFLKSENYFWNSGMFFWKNSTLFSSFQNFMPDLADGIVKMNEAIQNNDMETLSNVFSAQEKISIDYGIMERSANVVCVKATYSWDDIGTWEAVSRMNPRDEKGNIVIGDSINIESSNSIIYRNAENAPFVATLGVDNLVIVSSKDAVLVCKRDEIQRVKEIVADLKINNLNDLI